MQARALIAYHVGDYRELFHLLASRNYSESSHTELQQLWFAGHYAVAQACTSCLITMHHSHRPHCASCTSVRPSACLSVPYVLLTRKQTGVWKPKLGGAEYAAPENDGPQTFKGCKQRHVLKKVANVVMQGWRWVELSRSRRDAATPPVVYRRRTWLVRRYKHCIMIDFVPLTTTQAIRLSFSILIDNLRFPFFLSRTWGQSVASWPQASPNPPNFGLSENLFLVRNFSSKNANFEGEKLLFWGNFRPVQFATRSK